MRRLSKEESRQRFTEGRNLWNEFDPIGVFEIESDWPKDEYESYVGPTLRLCEEGKSSTDLLKYVEGIVYDHMGLSHAPLRQQAIEEFAARFRNWYRAKWPDTVV